MVRLPKRMGFEQMIGESKDMALRRLMQLERRLGKDEDLRSRYNEAMQMYLDQQHIFDGSAKTTSNRSLNDGLMTGPVIQDPLFDLVLRFRKHPVAFVADIEKMYLQVKVHPDDTPLQRILWRFSPEEPVATYEMSRVTFGLAPSSFLATRCLHQLAEDEGNHHPRTKVALINDFYVDDYIGGADSVQKAILLRQDLEQLMPKGGFKLRKWVKALGIHWKPGLDLLGIDVSNLTANGQWTRRKVYSIIAQLWDPSGITAPVISWAKIRMQLLWVAVQGWDDPLSHDLALRWTEFYQQLPVLSDIQVERHAFTKHPMLVQFHVFSDASEAAYGACIYARSIDLVGHIKVELLAAKSRPASLKKTTLARLELCGAHVAAKLYRATVKALKMEDTETWFWSDSTVVLSWLKLPPYVLANFRCKSRLAHPGANEGTPMEPR
ncbi:uncharacterized protein LOC134206221 [Armigeres subalbatus]|uniref:uncharacterized protein LOC134206221 n=1 Tax=Armigeres subalbatus TaxID=124917 RepID=UPI002ED32C24